MIKCFKFRTDILYEPFYRGQTIFIGDYPNGTKIICKAKNNINKLIITKLWIGPVEKVRELLARKAGGASVFSEMFMLEVREDEDTEKTFSWFETAR